MISSARHERLGPEDWILAAIEAVRRDGADGVRIDRLCRDLGVTKGSFYHHFPSRRGLVEAIAEYWARTQPRFVAEQVLASQEDPYRRLLLLTRLFTDLHIGSRDHAMRAWGATEPAIHEAVSTADRQVVALLEGILRDMGLSKRQQHDFARVLMLSAIGFYTAPELVDDAGREQVAKQVLSLIRDAARTG